MLVIPREVYDFTQVDGRDIAMTWIWVVVVIVGIVGFLAWAAIRDRRYGGGNFARKSSDGKGDAERHRGGGFG